MEQKHSDILNSLSFDVPNPELPKHEVKGPGFSMSDGDSHGAVVHFGSKQIELTVEKAEAFYALVQRPILGEAELEELASILGLSREEMLIEVKDIPSQEKYDIAAIALEMTRDHDKISRLSKAALDGVLAAQNGDVKINTTTLIGIGMTIILNALYNGKNDNYHALAKPATKFLSRTFKTFYKSL